MAAFTQNLTSTVQVFGAADTEKWGTLVWGTDDWAKDDDMEFEVEKLITDACTASVALTFEADKIMTSTANVAVSYVTMTHQDSNGYVVIYPSDTGNVTSAASGSFSTVTIGSDSFTTQAITSTSWSTV
jgi:hypothetical protein